MIQKIKNMPLKGWFIICGTILAAISMITDKAVPDWVFKLFSILGLN